MPSSLSSSTATSSLKARRRKWTRQQLLRNLEVIGDLASPLPPTLPPSLPSSRAPARLEPEPLPAAGSKRKLPYASDPEPVKRPRTNSISEPQQSMHQTLPLQPSSHQSHYQALPQAPSVASRQTGPIPVSSATRPEPTEDGELHEEQIPPFPVAHASPVDSPIRRPKKGKPPLRHFDALHAKYHDYGRMLKYSGDSRFWSTFPSSHREYKPLPNPPDQSSPYYKHGGLIARLELLDALVCFTYAIWNRDIGRRTCIVETWQTFQAFLGWCKQKWQTEEGTNDSEKAFLGLIWMIEAFIQARQIAYTVRGHLDADMDKVVEGISQKIATAAASTLPGDSSNGLSGTVPPMLPSPTSTNSTPVNRDEGTPNSSNARSSQAAANGAHQQPPYTGAVPFKLLPEHLQNSPVPIPSSAMTTMEGVTEPIGPSLVQNLKDLTSSLMAISFCLERAKQSLNLPILRRCFPRTWTRMMYSTSLPNEEHEPDFEDEEGELYWPDQCISGEGLGWVCLMAKAMINEFGKAYGYKSVDGVVPKPKPEEQQRRQGPQIGYGPSSSSNLRHSTSSVPR